MSFIGSIYALAWGHNREFSRACLSDTSVLVGPVKEVPEKSWKERRMKETCKIPQVDFFFNVSNFQKLKH